MNEIATEPRKGEALLTLRKRGRPVGTGKPIKAGDDKMNRHTVRMTEREWAYCQEQGDASKFIRKLIAVAVLSR